MEKIALGQLLTRLQEIKQSQLTGCYTLYPATGPAWRLLFRLGRLAWGTGGDHRFRRWYRGLKQYCPDLDPKEIQLRDKDVAEDWEYSAIAMLVARQQLSREQGSLLIQQAISEVFFDMFQSFEGGLRLTGSFEPMADLGDLLALLDPEPTVHRTQQQWNSWLNAGFASLSPNLAPVLKQPTELEKQLSATTYALLKLLVNGNSSLRDLAVSMKQDSLMITRSFKPYLQQGLMGLQTIADLPEPSYQISELKVAVSTSQPLIICIDDSLSVCQTMSEVLTQANYRFIAIRDSLQALPTLLAQKPNLIFLDLVMPIASGYEICAQIRRVSAFKHVPVVILTGNDGIVDRVRAKMVGASDFLAKPIESDKVLAVIHRHLRDHTVASERSLMSGDVPSSL